MRDHWRQPHLQALDVPAAPSDAAGREADGEAASLLLTAGVVDDWMYAEVTRAYVLDADMQAFFARSNPWALKDMSARLLEAMDRGLWASPTEETRRAIEHAYLGAESQVESRAEYTPLPVTHA